MLPGSEAAGKPCGEGARRPCPKREERDAHGLPGRGYKKSALFERRSFCIIFPIKLRRHIIKERGGSRQGTLRIFCVGRP